MRRRAQRRELGIPLHQTQAKKKVTSLTTGCSPRSVVIGLVGLATISLLDVAGRSYSDGLRRRARSWFSHPPRGVSRAANAPRRARAAPERRRRPARREEARVDGAARPRATARRETQCPSASPRRESGPSSWTWQNLEKSFVTAGRRQDSSDRTRFEIPSAPTQSSLRHRDIGCGSRRWPRLIAGLEP